MVPKFHSPKKKKTTFPWFPGWYVLFSPRFYALGQVSDDCLFLVKFTWDHWLPLVGCFLVLDPSQKKNQKPAKHAKEWTLNMYKKGKIPGYSNYTAWYRIYIYIYTYMASYHNYHKGWWMEAWFSIPNLPIRLMISKKFRKKFQRRKFQHNRQHFQGAKKKRLMFSISRNRFFHFDWLLIPVGWRSPFEKSPKPFFGFTTPNNS